MNRMRYYVSLVIITAIGSFAGEFMAGAKAGINVGTALGKDIDEIAADWDGEKRPVFGPIAGTTFRYAISDRFFIGSEMCYSEKGVAVYFSDEDYAKVRLHCLELPVLAGLSLPVAPDLSLVLQAGPSLGIRLATTFIEHDGSGDPEKEDMTKETRPLDVGVALGGGFEWDRGTHRLFCAAMYTLGFVDIDKGVYGEKTDSRSSVVSLIAGILFPLKK
ncbi:MAG: PorT family protein [Chitinispirillaceae bacterium]|nr:PorT family protein [Chitinispirillaceae bacterium]